VRMGDKLNVETKLSTVGLNFLTEELTELTSLDRLGTINLSNHLGVCGDELATNGNRLCSVESLEFLILSVLPAASYIHKTLFQETLFFAIVQVCSSITVSCFPNHTLNFPTDFVLQSLRPFQPPTDPSQTLLSKRSRYLRLFRYHQSVALVRFTL